jgi:hypothetical protein
MIAIGLALVGCAATAENARPKNVGSGATANDRTCLTGTASRIPPNGTNCSATGRSYSGDDLMNTGKTTVAGALPLLDPSITIHH